jgi:hypothetical protein
MCYDISKCYYRRELLMYFYGDDYEDDYYAGLGINGYYRQGTKFAPPAKDEPEKEPEVALIYSEGMRKTIELIQERSKKNDNAD